MLIHCVIVKLVIILLRKPGNVCSNQLSNHLADDTINGCYAYCVQTSLAFTLLEGGLFLIFAVCLIFVLCSLCYFLFINHLDENARTDSYDY